MPVQGRRKPRRCQRRGGTNRRRLRGKACPSALPPLTSTHEGPACSRRRAKPGTGRSADTHTALPEPAEGDALAREGREADPEVRRARGRPPGEEERHGQAGLREGHGRADETGDSTSECSKQIAREKKNEKNG